MRGLAVAAVALAALAAPRAARAQTPGDELPPVLLEDAGGGTRRAAVVGLSATFAAVGLLTAVGVGVEAAGPERPSWAWLGAAYGPGAAANLGLGIAWLARERSGLATTLGVTHLAIGAANLGLGLWGAARPGRPPPKVTVVLTSGGLVAGGGLLSRRCSSGAGLPCSGARRHLHRVLRRLQPFSSVSAGRGFAVTHFAKRIAAAQCLSHSALVAPGAFTMH